MASPFSSIPISRDTVLYSIELLNDKEFLDKVNLGNLDLKDLQGCIFEARCEAAVKLVEIGQKKAGQCDSCAT